ncbi:elongator complex protein 4 isoform X3 [Ambystoma mexicanum]|uniref:elongator complex protein 4 isoform X3 n=1 Tax=Ambystoma mexicanum TaxID=8296 RepID=UPI0037E71A7D
MAASMSGVAGEVSATSFQRKPRCGGSKLLSIPGTRPSLRNGQLLVSSGVPSLDHIIGGGLAVGTLLLIEEDKYNIYSQLLLKYFLAEGVISGHSLFVGSAENNPKDILQELPAPSLDDLHKGKSDPEEISASKPSQESMKIAWRYQNLPKVSVNTVTSSRFGHYYDVTKTMSPEMLQSSQCHCFFLPEETLDSTPSICGMTYAYTRLLKSIHSVIHKEGFDGSCPQNKAIMGRATHLSDTAVGLESFIGSERETNPLYKEYHGLFRVNQLPRLNTMAPDTSGVKDLAFKLKRKLFTIEGPNVTQPLTGYLPTKETTEDGICWMQATTFASRLVRHSEPFKQTGSGRICKTAELRMWHNGCRREAPGLLVIYA